MGEIPDILTVLQLLVKGVASGFVLSFLAEKVKWFQGLESSKKSWLIFGVSLGLPLLGQVLIQFVPVEFWAVVQPYWNALATGFIIWTASQYMYVKEVRPYTEERRWTAAERIAVMLDDHPDEPNCCENGICNECCK